MTRSVLGLWKAIVLFPALAGIGLAQSLGGVQERKLSGPLPPQGTISRFSISDDQVHAVYVGDQVVSGQQELFSVRLDTVADPVRLNGVLPPGGDVLFETSWQDRVIYVAPRASDGTVELYVVPLEGGTSIVLNPPLVAGGNVGWTWPPIPPGTVYQHVRPPHASTAITPDGTRVAYLADQEVDGKTELYVVPIDGSGSATKLNHPLPAGWNVVDVKIDPAGSAAAYIVKDPSDDQWELYIVPLDGSSNARKIVEFAEVFILGPIWQMGDIRFSPDGQWITYRSFPQLYRPLASLHLVPADGSQAPIVLTDNAGFARTSPGGTFTAAGDAIVFIEQNAYAVSSCACGVVLGQFLNQSTFDGGETRLDQGTSNLTAYVHDQDSGKVFYSSGGSPPNGVFVVPEDGSAPPLQLAPGRATTLAISPDRNRLVYGDEVGLHSMSLAGGAPTDLHLATTGNFSDVTVSPNSGFVVYKVDGRSLYSVAIDGSSAPERSHGPLRGTQSVRDFRLANGRVVFLLNLPNSGRQELFLGVPQPLEGTRKSATAPMQPAGG